MFFVLLCYLLISSVVCYNEDYKGYRVYNIKLHDQQQEAQFYLIKNEVIEILRKPSLKYNIEGKVMVPPSQFNWYEERLTKLDIDRNVAIENVYEFLSTTEQASKRKSLSKDTSFDFDAFYRYNVILDHLYALQAAVENPTIKVDVIEHGKTEEGRPLVSLKITNGTETDKPTVIIEAGCNPREWITVPVALNVVNRIIEDPRRYLDGITWIVVPVMNPDGYEYTHTNLRYWSKSRSLNSHLTIVCPGVNLNRNFDIDWLISDSSSSPCSHIFAGVKPLSEPETAFIRDLIETYNPRAYISLQNNGKFVTYPWNYEKAASALFVRHHLLGRNAVKDLEDYELDAGAIAFGDRESGTSLDFARIKRVFYTYNVGVEGEGDDGVIVREEDIKIKVENVWKVVAKIASGVINN